MNNTFYLVRNGITIYNESSIFTGKLDIPLSKKGIYQAIELREREIDRINFCHVAYSSYLERGFQTGLIIAGLAELFSIGGQIFLLHHKGKQKIDLIPDYRLAERHLGDLQGIKKDELATIHNGKYKDRPDVTRSFTDKPDGGESFEDIEKLVASFFDDLSQIHEGKHILISTHNGPMKASLKYFSNLPDQDVLNFEFNPCEIYEFHK
ncbi:MAG TPA: histidine phosphatase family protein [Candidatus Nanoarchaeia archaeon]|nr:histidine phosphatase family protein [Candidatus Nanoarchaeia archaeon]